MSLFNQFIIKMIWMYSLRHIQTEKKSGCDASYIWESDTFFNLTTTIYNYIFVLIDWQTDCSIEEWFSLLSTNYYYLTWIKWKAYIIENPEATETAEALIALYSSHYRLLRMHEKLCF